jgi:thiol-disulfide isomerase/thioredoxin
MELILIFMLVFSSLGVVLAETLMDPIVGKPKASGFNLVAVDGSKVSLDGYQGKFVLLNFWATWCAPCRKEMPAMSNLHNQLKGRGLDVVGVHVGPSLAGVKKFLQSVPVNFTILIDKDMSLASWGVRGLPTTFLVNPEGRLIYKAVGEREWDSPEMVKFLNGLIVSYERMANGEQPVPKEKKSFFASFKESISWKCDSPDVANKLLPN